MGDDLQFGSSRETLTVRPLSYCRRCGLAWQDPLPDRETLQRLYREMPDEVYLSEQAGRRRAFRRGVRLLGRACGGRRGRLLDVGCSAGLGLEVAAADGWDVFGVEPSLPLGRIAQQRFGERIVLSSFEDAALEAGSFDAMAIWDVLEHMRDPVLALAKAASGLRAGGWLAVNVPNVESLIARSLGARWPLLLPEHLYYFSPRSLRRLLARAGFESPRFHLHPVYFSVGYVLRRLRQHRLPASRLAEAAAHALGLHAVVVPLLMGELTVLARRSGAP